MRLSFDLDGVIADTDNGVLGLLHQADRDGQPGASFTLQQYYARRRIILDPRGFTGPDDEFHIVTGRVPTSHGVTRAWVQRWLGFSALENLHLVSDSSVEKLFEQGKAEEASVELGQRKLRSLRVIKAQIHFDNNPAIVAYLRASGMTAVLVGGGLL